jgi:protein-L-isoaspartate(D-aspartate) O-methyltransferase
LPTGVSKFLYHRSMNDRTRDASRLVDELRRQGIDNDLVLGAMARVAREEFVPAGERHAAYANQPLPIGEGQTISQPYIVALMTQAAGVTRGDRVLEIGTGSGYQTAVLAEMGCEVYSIEIRPALARAAAALLDRPQWHTHLRTGDGHAGWASAAPFKAILITAAPKSLPPELAEQLEPGGRIVAPLGETHGVQRLVVHERRADGSLRQTDLGGVRFVPMISN